MKRFHFGLDRVRQWREGQVTAEKAHLEKLFSEKALIERRLAVLNEQDRESAAVVKSTRALDPLELRAADAFHRFANTQRKLIAGVMAACDRRIAEQQLKLMEARRKAELLNRLKDRKWKAWNTEFNRELETQAGEIFLAKWATKRQ